MNPVARKLLIAFTQFHRLNWKQSPVEGLKPSEIFVLFCIKRAVKPASPGIKISDISSTLRVATPTTTQLVNSLEKGGFVERTTDKEDRRAVRVKLTEKGEGMVKKASDSLFDSFSGLVEYLGEEESNELAELLSKTFVYFNEIKKEDL